MTDRCHIYIPEADAAELAGAVAELADGEAHARLVLLDPLRGFQVADVAEGHGSGLVPGRCGGARRVVGRRAPAAAHRGRSGHRRRGVEHVEVVRPDVVRRVRHGRGREVCLLPGGMRGRVRC